MSNFIQKPTGKMNGSTALNLGRTPPTVSVIPSTDTRKPRRPKVQVRSGHLHVFRGINQPPVEAFGDDDVRVILEDSEIPLGMHWTTVRHVADYFATSLEEHTPDFFIPRTNKHGVVFEAIVNNRHIVQEGSEEWEQYEDRHGVMSSEDNDFEKEVTIRPGSLIKIIAQHNVHIAPSGRLVRKTIVFDKPKRRST
jgi:hypothetical protein